MKDSKAKWHDANRGEDYVTELCNRDLQLVEDIALAKSNVQDARKNLLDRQVELNALIKRMQQQVANDPDVADFHQQLQVHHFKTKK